MLGEMTFDGRARRTRACKRGVARINNPTAAIMYCTRGSANRRKKTVNRRKGRQIHGVNSHLDGRESRRARVRRDKVYYVLQLRAVTFEQCDEGEMSRRYAARERERETIRCARIQT